jgi:hypothetical protein
VRVCVRACFRAGSSVRSERGQCGHEARNNELYRGGGGAFIISLPLSIYMPTHPPMSPSIRSSVPASLSTHPSVCVCVCVCLFICLAILPFFLNSYLSVCLSFLNWSDILRYGFLCLQVDVR